MCPEKSLLTSNYESERFDGEKVGLEKGKREIAKKLKEMGMTFEEIQKITELFLDELEKL